MKWVLGLLVAANLAYFIALQLDSGEQGALAAVAPPDIQQGGHTLKLLSESGQAVSAQSSTASAPATEPLCWMLGPLAEEVSAKQVQLRFQSQEIEADLREIETTTGLDYLLYIGPFASRDEGLARLRELHGEGVDSFLITRGSLSNAISLGLFSSVAQAETALEAYKGQGYDAHIRENERTAAQQWLVVPMAAAEALDLTFWDELSRDFAGLERKQNWCNSIASADGIE